MKELNKLKQKLLIMKTENKKNINYNLQKENKYDIQYETALDIKLLV